MGTRMHFNRIWRTGQSLQTSTHAARSLLGTIWKCLG